MKLSKTMLSLLLSSALWAPAALAQQPDNNASAPSNASGATSATPAAPATAAQPSNAAQPSTPAQPSTSTGAGMGMGGSSMDMSGWTGKTVTGSDGKKLGKVGSASGDKVTLDTKWGSVELAANLVAADESGNIKASTTSSQDVQAMAKSQKGDTQGAAKASKRHVAAKPKKATEETAPAGATPTEQAPAGETPAAPTTPEPPAAPEPPPAPQQPPANQSQPPQN